PGQRLDGALQLEQRKCWRHQFEDDRTVLDLAAQPADRGREDAAMVKGHRHPGRAVEGGGRTGGPDTGAARRLGDKPRLVEQLVAFEDQLLVPCRAMAAKDETQT